MNHRKEKDRRLRLDLDHVRSSRDKRLKPLNRSVKRPPSNPSKRRDIRERRLKHKHQENKNPNQATALALSVLNNSHLPGKRSTRMTPSPHQQSRISSRSSRSHRHSFKSNDRHSPWPPGEFDRSRGNKIDFDVSRIRNSVDIKRGRISFDDIKRRDFDIGSSRRRKEKRSLKVVRFAPDVQVFEYPNGTPVPSQPNEGPPGPAPNPYP